MNILITGGNGYIAKSLSNNLDFNVTSITRKDFDLTDRNITNEWFKGKYFDAVIHTAVKGGSRLKKDNGETLYQNIQMFYNLLNNKHCFERLIHFGSGAELGIPYSPYGLSKNIIYNLVKKEHGFFNIRIFGVFDENELETRFIKSSIKKYINKEPIIIHQDKQMDFFYMKDLITLVNDYLINNIHTSLSKNAECSYRKKYTLSDIANYINTLNNYKVPIQILDSSIGNPYIGNTTPNLSFLGLEQGIKETYKKILNETN